MEAVDVITEVSVASSSRKSGTITFLIAGYAVFLKISIPIQIINSWGMVSDILNGLSIYFIASLFGMTYFTIKYRKDNHLSKEICPKCNGRVKYTGIKCLSEDCGYKVKL